MSNVASIGTPKPSMPEDVIHFLESKAQKHDIAPDAARQRVMAIRQILSVVAEDETPTLEWLLENLDMLASRWATKNPEKKGATAVTYASRARASIEDYQRWTQDPTGFRFKTRESPAPRVRPKPVEQPSHANDATPIPPTVQPASASELRHFPLPNGRAFSFVLPEGFTMDDLSRVACHLATYAPDFEPNTLGELRAMTKR